MGTPPQRVFLPTKRTGHNARQRGARPHCRPAPGHSSNHPHCYPRCRLPTASTSTPAPLHYDRPFRRCAPSAFHPDSPPRGQKPRLPVNSSTSIRRPIPQQNRQSPRIPPPPEAFLPRSNHSRSKSPQPPPRPAPNCLHNRPAYRSSPAATAQETIRNSPQPPPHPFVPPPRPPSIPIALPPQHSPPRNTLPRSRPATRPVPTHSTPPHTPAYPRTPSRRPPHKASRRALHKRLRRCADTRFGPPRTSFGPIRPIMTQIGYLLFYLLNIILYIWR